MIAAAEFDDLFTASFRRYDVVEPRFFRIWLAFWDDTELSSAEEWNCNRSFWTDSR